MRMGVARTYFLLNLYIYLPVKFQIIKIKRIFQTDKSNLTSLESLYFQSEYNTAEWGHIERILIDPN